MTNEVKQRGILSPKLFNWYMDILDICAKYAIEHDLTFNKTKTMYYVFFSPRRLAQVESVLKLNDSPIL